MGASISAEFHIYALCFHCKVFTELDNRSKYLTPQWLDFRVNHSSHRVDMSFRTPRGADWKSRRRIVSQTGAAR